MGWSCLILLCDSFPIYRFLSGYQSRLIFLHIVIQPGRLVMFVACGAMIGGSECIYLVVLSLPVPSPLAMAQLNGAL
jgi:hypothetical protein